MRPSDITDGNMVADPYPQPRIVDYHRFNEAVGYYRRKHERTQRIRDEFTQTRASMRPSDITDGNTWASVKTRFDRAGTLLQ